MVPKKCVFLAFQSAFETDCRRKLNVDRSVERNKNGGSLAATFEEGKKETEGRGGNQGGLLR